MSDLHKIFGHFSLPTQRKIRNVYSKHCAICRKPTATDYDGQTDHIISLYLFGKHEKFAAEILGTNNPHCEENCWLLCISCHAKKTNEENANAGDFRALLAIARRYWAAAYGKRGRIIRPLKGHKVPQYRARLRMRKERAEARAAKKAEKNK